MFSSDMTVSQALKHHSKAKEVFSAFNMGGCFFCHVAEYETIEQICEGYEIPISQFLNTLNGLFENNDQSIDK